MVRIQYSTRIWVKSSGEISVRYLKSIGVVLPVEEIGITRSLVVFKGEGYGFSGVGLEER